MLTGFAVTMSLVLIALEWNFEQEKDASRAYISGNLQVMPDLVPVTRPKEPEKLPPVKPLPDLTFSMVEDESKIIDEFLVHDNGIDFEDPITPYVQQEEKNVDDEKIWDFADVSPAFKGGLDEFRKFVVK
ncbi:MAG: hypothetical protein HC896_10470, partial [Bacteroidales bacterium]|nr:hypothetical protein [Bacteroidales bacterium]